MILRVPYVFVCRLVLLDILPAEIGQVSELSSNSTGTVSFFEHSHAKHAGTHATCSND